MNNPIIKNILLVTTTGTAFLIVSIVAGLCIGSSDYGPHYILKAIFNRIEPDPNFEMILWQLRFPRVLLAVIAGGALSLGGLVFQALLRNPLSEPYILGISGGSAIGAIIGIQLGFSYFPGVSFLAFSGSLITLIAVMIISSGNNIGKDSMILSGVMINAFCSAVIMFLISISIDYKIHNIMFWLMGDFSSADPKQALLLLKIILPCFLIIFIFSNKMNILLSGREMASSMGINVKKVMIILLVVTSLMVSVTVCYCGLIGFVGLVIPHILRLILGSDHRVLVPASILFGGSYMVLCDLLSRTLPTQAVLPVGVITAMTGAPLFIYLLRRVKNVS
ncbi:MAG: iron ABC transporter permease [Deltaproteobacteria bacterium]|nr:iron ABC transporter permease [Deltaproteobacteria bacterium]